MNKKILSLMMALVMMFSMTTMVFADEVVLQGDNTGQGNVEVVVMVEPITTLNVDVPLNVNFTIAADRSMNWAPAVITSNCPAPLDVKILSVTPAVLIQDEIDAGYVNAPTLVADDAFVDWNNLTKSQTRDNIAISINGANLSVANQVIGQLESGFDAPTTLALTGSAFYGKAWPNTANQYFKYDMIIEVSMQE